MNKPSHYLSPAPNDTTSIYNKYEVVQKPAVSRRDFFTHVSNLLEKTGGATLEITKEIGLLIDDRMKYNIMLPSQLDYFTIIFRDLVFYQFEKVTHTAPLQDLKSIRLFLDEYMKLVANTMDESVPTITALAPIRDQVKIHDPGIDIKLVTSLISHFIMSL